MNSLFSKDQEANNSLVQGTTQLLNGVKRLHTLTSLGADLHTNDMLIDRKLEAEEHKKMEGLIVISKPKMLNAEFQRDKKEFVDLLILKTRFKDTRDRKVLLKRRDEWIKDLNMNLVRGKVIRSTHYFDDLEDAQKMTLLKALDSEAGMRDDTQCKAIEAYVRSMTFLKPYSEFESVDFQSVVQEIKLQKVKAGQRITTYGDMADSVHVIINGRIAISHPNELYL